MEKGKGEKKGLWKRAEPPPRPPTRLRRPGPACWLPCRAGGAASLGLLPTAGRRGRAARGSRCRVAMATLPHPDCSWQRGPAARQALGGDPRERARQAAHSAARPPGPSPRPPATRPPAHRRPRGHRRPSCSSPADLRPPPPRSPHSLIQQTFADVSVPGASWPLRRRRRSHPGTQRHPRPPNAAHSGGGRRRRDRSHQAGGPDAARPPRPPRALLPPQEGAARLRRPGEHPGAPF